MPLIKVEKKNELIQQYANASLVIQFRDLEYLNAKTEKLLKELEWVETDEEVILKLYQIPLSYPYIDQETLVKDLLALVKTYYQQRKKSRDTDDELINRITNAFKDNHGVVDHYFYKILEEE